MYYDRQTQPLSQREWVELLERGGREYNVVEQTTLPNGLWVSTVWLGLDHSFRFDAPPLIFETMVFPSQHELSELDQNRYTFESEARAGHKAMCEKYASLSELELAELLKK